MRHFLLSATVLVEPLSTLSRPASRILLYLRVCPLFVPFIFSLSLFFSTFFLEIYFSKVGLLKVEWLVNS